MKELICTTHGYKLRAGGMLEGVGVPDRERNGRKIWDNWNSIMNKIHLKIKIKGQPLKNKGDFSLSVGLFLLLVTGREGALEWGTVEALPPGDLRTGP